MPIEHRLRKATGAENHDRNIATASEHRLADWVTPETWHSGSPLDDIRFFRFFSALWMESRAPIDSDELFAQIADVVLDRHPDIDPELLERTVDRYVEKAQLILRYNRAMVEADQALDDDDEILRRER
jgi:hypothetical protein